MSFTRSIPGHVPLTQWCKKYNKNIKTQTKLFNKGELPGKIENEIIFIDETFVPEIVELVECLECHKKFNRITNKHLKTHELTDKEYIEKHSTDDIEVKLITDTLWNEYSKATKGKEKSKEQKEKMAISAKQARQKPGYTNKGTLGYKRKWVMY